MLLFPKTSLLKFSGTFININIFFLANQYMVEIFKKFADDGDLQISVSKLRVRGPSVVKSDFSGNSLPGIYAEILGIDVKSAMAI